MNTINIHFIRVLLFAGHAFACFGSEMGPAGAGSSGAVITIHEAVKRNDIATLQELLREGADVKITDKNERTVLHWAAGCKDHAYDHLTPIERAKTAQEETPSDSQINPIEIITALLAHVRDNAITAGIDHETAVLDFTEMTDDALKTPLHYAAEYGHVAAVQALLAAGADAEAKDLSDNSPLYYAVIFGHTAIVQLFLEHVRTKTVVEEFVMAINFWDTSPYLKAKKYAKKIKDLRDLRLSEEEKRKYRDIWLLIQAAVAETETDSDSTPSKRQRAV
jgi:hypothetical protein